jgi:glyoxylase-like metal-dependent hydrolase (beta-lactamase superfamily II)/rhodanese-related sulfurtransferase
MYFRQFMDEGSGCLSYVIASRDSLEAAIVDPGLNTARYEDLLRARALKLRYVIDTHVHADHVSGARRLVASCGGDLCLHEAASVAYPFRPLRDGEELSLGSVRLRVLHTPGHRVEMMSLAITDVERGMDPSMILTGDCLLVGDAGRPDFHGGDAGAQYVSVHRLLELPDWVSVFPGHFEGPCGSSMAGPPSTTIGFERLHNLLIRLEQSRFVDTIATGIPARPLNMTAIEATNRGLADMPWAMPLTTAPVHEIDADTVAERCPPPFLLDVREPEEYVSGHMPDAHNLPQADLASRLEEVPRDRPVTIVCEAGERSRRAAQFLEQAGFQDVSSLRGGMEAWRAAGKPIHAGNDA